MIQLWHDLSHPSPTRSRNFTQFRQQQQHRPHAKGLETAVGLASKFDHLDTALATLAEVPRKRRVRCDEEYPACKKCTSTGRHCDGYPEIYATKKVKPQPMIMMIVTDFERATYDPTINMHLQYFFHVSAPTLTNHRTSAFWNTTVLQACQQVRCIRDLAIAVASLERFLRCSANADIDRNDTEVHLVYYSKALQQLSANQDMSVILVGCLMLVLLEDLRRNPYAALVHVRAGRQLLITKHNTGIDPCLFDNLQAVFTALYEHQPELAANDVRVGCIYKQDDKPRPRPYPSGLSVNNSSTGFGSLEHAWRTLQSLRHRCVTPQPYDRPLSRFHVIPGLTEELNDWLEQFNVFTSQLSHQQQGAYKSDIHGLRAYHLILKIASCCTTQDKETWYDYHDQDFEGLVKKFAIMCSMGRTNLAPLIFFVACKYRDVAGRRRAIDLLRYRVNDWTGALLADVAEMVVQLEEGGLDDPVTSGDIPERCRVRPKAIIPAPHSVGQAALCVLCAPFNAHSQVLAVDMAASTSRLVDGIDATLKHLVGFIFLLAFVCSRFELMVDRYYNQPSI